MPVVSSSDENVITVLEKVRSAVPEVLGVCTQENKAILEGSVLRSTWSEITN